MGQRISIAVLVTLVLVLTVTALLGAFGYFSYRTTSNQQRLALRTNERILADQLAAALAVPIWNFDREQIDRIMDGAMRDEDVGGVVVRLADERRTVQARARDDQWKPRSVAGGFPTGDLLVERRSIVAGDMDVGTVDVFVTPRFVEADLRRTRLSIIAAVLAFDLVLVLVLGGLLWWLVLRPLKEVEIYAASVRSGDRPETRPDQGRFRGELESLRASIADMVELLDGRYRALRASEVELRASEAGLRASEERHRAIAAEQMAQNARYARHQAALTVLTRSHAASPDDLIGVLNKVTEVVAVTLEVAYVGIWRLTEHGQALVCEDEFDQPARHHTSGARLTVQEDPQLFTDETDSDIVTLEDSSAHTPLAQARLMTRGVSSMMRVQIRAQGVRIGVLTAEHTGAPRTWTPDEQTFFSAVAHLISAQMAQTERQRAEAQLRQAHKMGAIGQLAGGVAHDFNNILTVILGKAAVASADTSLPDPVRGAIADIADAGGRAAALTRQLLTFSRRQPIQKREVDLNDSVANLSRMLKRIVGEDIALDVQYAPHPLHVRADPGMLDQVLLNLAINARDAMPGGGHIGIRTSAVRLDGIAVAHRGQGRPGRFACLQVADGGGGIRPEHLPHIFEPFFTTKDIGKGTGLGLATTYGIVQQHEGWIEVDSAVGAGSVFSVFLPEVAATARPAPVATRPATSVHGSETILVVEDEHDVRTLVVEALAGLGYRVLEASSGPEAIEVWHVHDGRVDLVLTDMTMPDGMSGLDLVRRLRAQTPAVKAIYTSGYFADISSADIGLGPEAAFYLAKPFTVADLARMVRRCLDAGRVPAT